jgi:hypothetical protein
VPNFLTETRLKTESIVLKLLARHYVERRGTRLGIHAIDDDGGVSVVLAETLGSIAAGHVLAEGV